MQHHDLFYPLCPVPEEGRFFFSVPLWRFVVSNYDHVRGLTARRVIKAKQPRTSYNAQQAAYTLIKSPVEALAGVTYRPSARRQG